MSNRSVGWPASLAGVLICIMLLLQPNLPAARAGAPSRVPRPAASPAKLSATPAPTVPDSDAAIIVGGDQSYPPYEYLENGQPQGFNIDLVRAVAEVMGLQVEFRLGPWSEARAQLERGEVDMLSGMLYSAERDRLVDFSVPHTLVSPGLFVRNDSPVRALSDLDGREVMVQEGDLMHDLMRQNELGADLITTADPDQALRMLSAGQYDAVLLSSRIQGHYFIDRYNLSNLRPVGIDLEPREYGFAVKDGDVVLLNQLNEGLNILKRNGVYHQLQDKWFGVYETNPLWQTLGVLTVVLAAILLLLGISLAWSNSLRNQVRRRTSELRGSEARYRHLVERIPAIVYTAALDSRHGLSYVSPMVEPILGYRPEEFQSDPGLWVEQIHPDDRERVLAEYRALPAAKAGASAGMGSRASEITLPALRLPVPGRTPAIEHTPVTGSAPGYGREIPSRPAPREGAPDGAPVDELADDRQANGSPPAEGLPVSGQPAESASPGEPQVLEYRVYARDGRTIWLRDEAVLVLDDSGRPVARQGVITDITASRQAERRLQRQVQRMAALRLIDLAITGSIDMNLPLRILLEQAAAQLSADACTLLLLNAHTHQLEYFSGIGFRTLVFKDFRLSLGQGYAGQAALERRLVHLAIQDGAGIPLFQTPAMAAEGFINYYGMPLIVKGAVKGVLELFYRSPFEPDAEWMNFLEALAGQAAIAIDNAGLFEGLQQANDRLITAYDDTIYGWARALELRDGETEGHSRRVTEVVVDLAQALGFQDEALVHIRRGALLHDIGKMGIPDNILLKPGQLDAAEWQVMRRHPQYSFELLSSIDFLRPALDIPYCHHERWDGGGYPRGLRGDEIPLAARIFALVDVWDALCSNRPYRPAWQVERIIAYLQAEAGRQFDPQVVKAFFDYLQQRYPGRYTASSPGSP